MGRGDSHQDAATASSRMDKDAGFQEKVDTACQKSYAAGVGKPGEDIYGNWAIVDKSNVLIEDDFDTQTEAQEAALDWKDSRVVPASEAINDDHDLGAITLKIFHAGEHLDTWYGPSETATAEVTAMLTETYPHLSIDDFELVEDLSF